VDRNSINSPPTKVQQKARRPNHSIDGPWAWLKPQASPLLFVGGRYLPAPTICRAAAVPANFLLPRRRSPRAESSRGQSRENSPRALAWASRRLDSHPSRIPAGDAGEEADAAADGGGRGSLLRRLLLVTQPDNPASPANSRSEHARSPTPVLLQVWLHVWKGVRAARAW
jgi:hypothetical protein